MTSGQPYAVRADVYEWLVPDALLTPERSARAFDAVVDGLPVGSRALDCACGTGQLAVGLALAGFDVTASDVSDAMVRRTRDAGHSARRPRSGPSRTAPSARISMRRAWLPTSAPTGRTPTGTS